MIAAYLRVRGQELYLGHSRRNLKVSGSMPILVNSAYEKHRPGNLACAMINRMGADGRGGTPSDQKELPWSGQRKGMESLINVIRPLQPIYFCNCVYILCICI